MLLAVQTIMRKTTVHRADNERERESESRGCTPPGFSAAAAHRIICSKIKLPRLSVLCLSPLRAAKWAVCSWVSHTHRLNYEVWRRCARVREDRREQDDKNNCALWRSLKGCLLGWTLVLIYLERPEWTRQSAPAAALEMMKWLVHLATQVTLWAAAGAEFVTHTLTRPATNYISWRRLRPTSTCVLFDIMCDT